MSERRLPLLGAGILAAITILAYLPALHGGFVFDDITFLVQNRLVRSEGGLARFWASTNQTDFWPVTYTALWAEWRLWGMHVVGYHVVNLALHIGECLLLWRILCRLRVPGAYLAALLFAVHPVNVESVAWIIQIKNLTAMGFFLLSILAYINYEEFLQEDREENLPNHFYREIGETGETGETGGTGGHVAQCGSTGTLGESRSSRSGLQLPDLPVKKNNSTTAAFRSSCKKWYCISLLLFVLAMLSKGSVAIEPLVLLGLILWRRPFRRRDAARLAPYFAVSAGLVLVDIWFQKHGSDVAFRHADFLQRLLGAGAVIWFYLYKALLPLHLIFVYPQWHIRAADPLWWLPLVAATALTASLLRYRLGPARPALAAWAYYGTALAPVMGFTDVYFMKYSLVADHYQHLALIGVVAFAGFLWSLWSSQPAASGAGGRSFPVPITLPNAAAAAVVLVLAALTWSQCHIYRDSTTLWSSVTARNPESSMAQNNLGIALDSSGRSAEAMDRYRKELGLDPKNPMAHNNIGMMLARRGDFAGAQAQFEEALRDQPAFPDALVNLGNIMQEQGRGAEASVCYRRAVGLDPTDADAHCGLGDVLAANGQTAAAAAEFEEAVRLKPDNADAFRDLGNALSAMGRQAEAVEDYRKAVRLIPGDAAAHAGLAAALADLGRMPEAVPEYEAAVRLKPDVAETRYNLGDALAQTGRVEDAEAQFREAIRLRPDYAEAHANLGIALARTGSLPEGARELARAAQLSPNSAQIHYILGEVLRALEREDEAKAEFEKAAQLGYGH